MDRLIYITISIGLYTEVNEILKEQVDRRKKTFETRGRICAVLGLQVTTYTKTDCLLVSRNQVFTGLPRHTFICVFE